MAQIKAHAPTSRLVFDKEAKNIIVNKWSWSNRKATCRRKKLDPYLSHCTNFNSNGSMINTGKPELLHLKEEKVENTLQLTSTGKDI